MIMELCDLPIGRVETDDRKESKVTEKMARAEINKALESVLEIDTRKAKIIRK